MSRTCSFEGCTFDETGLCVRSLDPSACEHVISEDTDNTSDDAGAYQEVVSYSSDLLGAPVLAEPEVRSALAFSRSLGLEELNSLMSSRYVHVVGILGEPESGKTACLVSLYLLVSHAILDGWSCADSRSLAAFEEIARGARDWNNGIVPDQMTAHTELTEDHRPGFLHLRLVRRSDGRSVDLALPDVPGEWTQALISTARSDRFDFMRSAETIWIVLDGRILANLEKRQKLIARVGQLIGRLNTMLEGLTPRLLIVVTHSDAQIINNDVVKHLQREAARRGTSIHIVNVAPFSDQPEKMDPGYGIAELINMTIGEPPEQPTFWQVTEPAQGRRAYLSYRRDR
jgi:hypothetical protein